MSGIPLYGKSRNPNVRCFSWTQSDLCLLLHCIQASLYILSLAVLLFLHAVTTSNTYLTNCFIRECPGWRMYSVSASEHFFWALNVE